MEYKGLFTDMAITVGVGEIKPIYKKLIKTTKESLDQAIKTSKVNNTLGDVGYAIQKCVEKQGFVVVKGLVGHGVGYSPHEDPVVYNYGTPHQGIKYSPHEDPVVYNYGTPHQGIKLEEGMVIAIEPMVTFDGNGYSNRANGDF